LQPIEEVPLQNSCCKRGWSRKEWCGSRWCSRILVGG
jgi:hypothetical protein